MQIREGIEISDEDAVEYDKLIEQYYYYDRLQYVYKIKLNSLYGALTNFYFRFFNLKLGQSTTGTGRAILDHMCSKTAEVLDGTYDMFSDSIAYGDSVAGDSLIYTDAGDVYIEDLFKCVDETIGTKQYHHPTNLNVLTYDEAANKSCYKPVKYIMRHKNTKTMYRVWVTDSSYIDVTEDHSLMGHSVDVHGISQIGEVKPHLFDIDNHKLIVPSFRDRWLVVDALLPRYAYVMVGWIFASADITMVDEVITIPHFKSNWASGKLLSECSSLGLITSIQMTRDTLKLSIADKYAHIFSDLVSPKEVPNWILSETTNNISHILMGMHWGSDNGLLSHRALTVVQQVQQLMLYCGVPSLISQCIGVDGVILYTINIVNDVINRTDCNTGYGVVGVNRVEQIESIEYVYDIEVDDTHTFFANNILVHNTDSVYFNTNAEHLTGLSVDDMNTTAITIADAVGRKVDDSFDKFCEDAFCVQPQFSGIIRCDREVVARRGIFVSKKRYVLKLIDKDGYRVDELKAMGLEMKKTTTPKAIQLFLAEVVNMILSGDVEWDDIDDYIIKYRDNIMIHFDTFDIGLPKGVKKVEHYTQEYAAYGDKARLPGHVAASIFYNICLKEYGDTENPPIITGTKIKVFYLNRKYGKFKSIAVPTDSGRVPDWFTEHFTVDRTMHEQRLIDRNLIKIFGAIGKQVPTKQSKFNNNLLDWD